MTLPFHPYADAFPLIEGEEFNLLIGDIRDNGLRKRIDLYEQSILDGRNRFNALKQLTETGEILGSGWGHRAGECLDPDMLIPASDNFLFHTFDPNMDGDPISYVASLNLRRRDLKIGQRAYAVAELGRLGWGGDRSKPSREGLSTERRAEIGGISRATVERAQVVVDQGITELKHALKHGDLDTAPAEKIARLPEAEQPAALERALPNGHRAIMGSRQEPDDSLDYFPTPPWATRALVERVFRDANLPVFNFNSVWEPACGEGHIAEVLAEYARDVAATDIHDYGYGVTLDFLGDDAAKVHKQFDWIITNPPFGAQGEAFVTRALELARIGVAMFFRVQWLDTIGRYERIFRDRPPTMIAFFAERVPLHKGRWEPEGNTATAYMWLVWIKGSAPRAPFWIPPGQRDALTKPDDVERFTAKPVKKSESREPAEGIDPDHTATGGVLIPSMVAEQSGESEAGETSTVSASAPMYPALLAPGEPASVEGANGDARSHAPPESISRSRSESNEGQDRVNGIDAAADGVASRLSDGRTSDAGAVTAAPAPIPREEASGTTRKVPSTGCGTSDESQNVGIQSAPPQFSEEVIDLPDFLRWGDEARMTKGEAA